MMKRLPVVYIAGRYRAPTPFQIQGNIRRAQELALWVWKMGAVALCPHANTALFDGEAPDDVWLHGDIELLRRCDAILMMDGWQESSGATYEHLTAQALPLATFYQARLEALESWIPFITERLNRQEAAIG